MRWLEITAAAAVAAKSLQSCPTLCNPMDGSPPGSPIPGILQARTLEWVAIAFSNAWKWKVKVNSLSRVRLLATPWTAAHRAPPSMGLSRQEYWSGVPLPSPRNHWMCSSRNHDNTSEMLRAVGGVFHQGASGISSNFKTSGNPRDRGTWWAAVYRVAQSRRRLKWLSSRKCPGSPVVRTPCSHCWGPGFNPWPRN